MYSMYENTKQVLIKSLLFLWENGIYSPDYVLYSMCKCSFIKIHILDLKAFTLTHSLNQWAKLL